MNIQTRKQRIDFIPNNDLIMKEWFVKSYTTHGT